MIRVKICGVKDVAAVEASVSAGANYLGFNFFEASPRFVTPADANRLAEHVPPGVAKVCLTVDASNDALDAITSTAPFDMLQLHGKETPERVTEVRARYGLPVMKVLPIADADDLTVIPAFEAVSDQILLDAKAPKDATMPGGHGVAFDWTLIAGRRWAVPWMLAGGLTPDNVGEAVRRTGVQQVDVSSGVEAKKGRKDADLIRQFVAAARS